MMESRLDKKLKRALIRSLQPRVQKIQLPNDLVVDSWNLEYGYANQQGITLSVVFRQRAVVERRYSPFGG